MRTIAFAPVTANHETLVASYRHPSRGLAPMRVEGWLTVEDEDGTRHVVPAVLDPRDEHPELVPVAELAVDGWEVILRLESWGPA